MEPSQPELGVTFILLALGFGLLLNLPAYWVFRKAGWSGWWFLLLVVPLAGLILLYIFAFKKWPIEQTGADATRSPGH